MESRRSGTGRNDLLKVRDGSERSPGGPGRVGMVSRRSGMGWDSLSEVHNELKRHPEVQDGSEWPL